MQLQIPPATPLHQVLVDSIAGWVIQTPGITLKRLLDAYTPSYTAFEVKAAVNELVTNKHFRLRPAGFQKGDKATFTVQILPPEHVP